jgi:membrane-associated phospholipid phosphatase
VTEKLSNTTHPLIENILRSTAIRWCARKNPKLYTFVISRLSVKRFTGLPLTGLICALVANLLLIMDFTPDVINSKEFVSIDNNVAHWFYSLRVDSLTRIFSRITYLCDIEFIIILCGTLLLFLIFFSKFHYISPLLLVLAGSGLTIYLGKNIFEIDRPYALAYEHEYSFSFPSGHATSAISVYGLLFYFIIRKTVSLKSKIYLTITALTFALLIGFSRLYLCVHYLSDVLGGYMLGSIWLLLAIGIFEWKMYLKHKPAYMTFTTISDSDK